MKKVSLKKNLLTIFVPNQCCQRLKITNMFLKYVPNAQLLIRLCKRLEINLNEISLADNYAVSSNKQFNKQVEYLCNQHQYSELKNYLESNNSNLKSAEQLQAYYYYLAVACLQTGELKAAEQDLKLSLAESGSILLSSGQLQTALMFAALILLVLIGVVSFAIVQFVEARVMPWHRSQRRDGH